MLGAPDTHTLDIIPECLLPQDLQALLGRFDHLPKGAKEAPDDSGYGSSGESGLCAFQAYFVVVPSCNGIGEGSVLQHRVRCLLIHDGRRSLGVAIVRTLPTLVT